MFTRADERFGRLDAIVVAAAALHVAPFDELTINEWDAMTNVVLRGGALAAMAATRRFLATQTPGRIVFVGSVSGRVADRGLAHYCAAKAGIDALARSIAVDLGATGITANVVAPGWINTPMIGRVRRLAAAGHPGGDEPAGARRAPKEVADVIRFLVCDAPSFLTGSTVTVDGGQTAMNHVLPE